MQPLPVPMSSTRSPRSQRAPRREALARRPRRAASAAPARARRRRTAARRTKLRGSDTRAACAVDACAGDGERARQQLGARRRSGIDVAPPLQMAQQPERLVARVVGAVAEREPARGEEVRERGNPRRRSRAPSAARSRDPAGSCGAHDNRVPAYPQSRVLGGMLRILIVGLGRCLSRPCSYCRAGNARAARKRDRAAAGDGRSPTCASSTSPAAKRSFSDFKGDFTLLFFGFTNLPRRLPADAEHARASPRRHRAAARRASRRAF